MLHAASFSQDIGSMMLVDALSSAQIVMNSYMIWIVRCTVAGALEKYDLPDVCRLALAGYSLPDL